MGKGNKPVEVRIDDATRARWEAHAEARGMTMSEFIRRSVEAGAPYVFPVGAKIC